MLLTKYKVGDLIIDSSALKVLMILESPHINEYIHGHPAAGESALELTQLLKSQGYVHDFDNQLPVGCNIESLKYKQMGILNCSHFPMNPAFYPCSLSDDERNQLNILTAIKQSLAQINSDEAHIALAKSDIFKDFANRLNEVLTQALNVIIVPCGHTAKGFIDAFTATYPKPLNILYGLPHPTETDWAERIVTINLSEHIASEILP